VHVTNSELSGGTCVIWLSNGHDHVIDGNTMDGHYDGSGGQVGADDGILLLNEANDILDDGAMIAMPLMSLAPPTACSDRWRAGRATGSRRRPGESAR
jgi:hypothetical protein